MVNKNNSFVLGSFILIGLGIVFCGSGCSTFSIVNPDRTIPATPTKESTGQYQVQMQGNFGKKIGFIGEIDGPVTVQTALDRSGAIEKFKNMDVTVLRVVKESGQPLKLPVDYQGSKKMVRPEQDYALHPNDVIVVSAQSKNALDKFVDTFSK